MTRCVRLVVTLVLALTLAGSPARGHGASRGLHLHLIPATAARGTKVEVRVDAAQPIVSVKVGLVGGEKRVVRPAPASRHAVVTLTVPQDAPGTTLNVSAEAHTEKGKVVRAAAILTLLEPPPKP